MHYSELHAATAPGPGSHPSRAGETIAEVAFTLLVIGVWLVTSLAG